jgi:hypothetical protein
MRQAARMRGEMKRVAIFFVFVISLAGAIALWPEDRSRAQAERMASALALELLALSATPQALRDRLDADPLIESVAIWNRDGVLAAPTAPRVSGYTLDPRRLRALEGLLAARVMPVWARAPFVESGAVVRCQRKPDVCIVFAEDPLAERLAFPPDRLTRPLRGVYALGPALMMVALAIGSGLALVWREVQLHATTRRDPLDRS